MSAQNIMNHEKINDAYDNYVQTLTTKTNFKIQLDTQIKIDTEAMSKKSKLRTNYKILESEFNTCIIICKNACTNYKLAKKRVKNVYMNIDYSWFYGYDFEINTAEGMLSEAGEEYSSAQYEVNVANKKFKDAQKQYILAMDDYDLIKKKTLYQIEQYNIWVNKTKECALILCKAQIIMENSREMLKYHKLQLITVAEEYIKTLPNVQDQEAQYKFLLRYKSLIMKS